MIERAPFRDATQALRYLLDPERVIVDRPPASRMADKHRGDPGSLSGMDGVATAASAISMLEGRLTLLQLAILACRYAPSRIHCECKADCCSGKKTNSQWRQAMSYVAHDALYQALPRGEAANLRFVMAVLLREYGKQKVGLIDLGAELGMSQNACTNHRRRVLDWLLYRPSERDESKEEKRPKGQEVLAYDAAEEVLRGGGFVE